MSDTRNPPICVGFSTSPGWLGRAIRWFTGGDVNHAFLLYWSRDWDRWLTLGANQNGLEPLTLDVFQRDRKIQYLFAADGWDLYAAMLKHVGDLGTPYNVRGLVGELFVETQRRIIGRYGRNFLDDHADLFCSEWVTAVCRTGIAAAQKTWALALEDDQVDPQTLRLACTPTLFAPVPLVVLDGRPVDG